MMTSPMPNGTEPHKLKVLVVEDEWLARNYLVELLQSSGRAELVGAVGDVDTTRELLKTAPLGMRIDVVFVDIELGDERREKAGLELVREISQMPEPPMTVLATAYDAHAIEAYSLGVSDYLLKPFDEDRVNQCLRRLLSHSPHVAPQAPARIVARRRRSLVFLERQEIWAFEASERLTFVHTQFGRFDLDLSLSAIEASFGNDFVRAHRSWLVNASVVKELERDGSETWLFVGTSLHEGARGVRVPVARERAQAVRSALLEDTAGLRRA